MSIEKFNLFELKKWPIDKPFPVEVNKYAREALTKLNISTDLICFYETPGNKFFGTAYAFDEKNILRATFEFIRGVAFKWDLINYFGNSQAHVQIFNPNVFKPKKLFKQMTQSEENDV